jgi:hypothetical protein
MKSGREAISLALFNLFATNTQLASLCKTITRTPKIWTTVDEMQKPFLCLFKGGPATEHFEQPQDRRIALTKYILHFNLWLYVTADPSGQVNAETTVNNIADAIDAAMQTGAQATSFGERQTLAGLVNTAWIDGGDEWGREFEDTNVVVFWRISCETGI